jgi:hypothetical protein
MVRNAGCCLASLAHGFQKRNRGIAKAYIHLDHTGIVKDIDRAQRVEFAPVGRATFAAHELDQFMVSIAAHLRDAEAHRLPRLYILGLCVEGALTSALSAPIGDGGGNLLQESALQFTLKTAVLSFVFAFPVAVFIFRDVLKHLRVGFRKRFQWAADILVGP